MGSKRFPLPTVLLFLRGVLRNPGVFIEFLAGRDVSRLDFAKVTDGLPNQPVIVEAGASDGSDSEKFLRVRPEARLFCFEPDPRLFALLVARVGSKATCIPKALGPRGGDHVEFWRSPADESSSILRPTVHEKYFPTVLFDSEPTLVRAVSLDAFLEEENFHTVDLLWLDLQGAELSVLRNGGLNFLSICRTVHIEVARISLYDGAPTLEEVVSFMNEQGFQLKMLKIPFIFGNAFFVKEVPES